MCSVFLCVDGVVRLLDHDIELQGYNVPANTIIQMLPSPYLKNETIFDDPHSFKPERWLRSSGVPSKGCPMAAARDKTMRDPYLLMHFGRGKRMCPGSRIAETEVSALFARLIQDWKVSLAPGSATPGRQSRSGINHPWPNPTYTFEPIRQAQA